MTAEYEDLSQYLGYWVKRLYLLSNQRMDSELQPYGLGRTQWLILYIIVHEGAMDQAQLKARLHIDSATITNIIATMVRKGWIEQQVVSTDRRYRTIALTRSGKKIWESLPDTIAAINAKLTEGIAAPDLQHAREVLMRAVSNLEQQRL